MVAPKGAGVPKENRLIWGSPTGMNAIWRQTLARMDERNGSQCHHLRLYMQLLECQKAAFLDSGTEARIRVSILSEGTVPNHSLRRTQPIFGNNVRFDDSSSFYKLCSQVI